MADNGNFTVCGMHKKAVTEALAACIMNGFLLKLTHEIQHVTQLLSSFIPQTFSIVLPSLR